MLKIIDVEKKYGNFKLKKLNFELKKGEFLSILGPSGCGKTTLLKIVAGLIEDYSGELFLEGKNIKNSKIENRLISMVFQEALLFPNMNVEENVAFGLKMKKIGKKLRLEKAKEILISLGLDGFGKRHPTELSGGEQQRVALARALVIEPKLILMDEPFSALDYNLRIEMQDLIKKIHKEKKMTILFVSHDKDEAFYLSDRIAVINNGEILQIDKPIDLYEKPKNEFIARFLGAKNIFKGEIKNGIFQNYNFNLKIPFKLEDSKVKIVIRPEIMKICNKENKTGFYAKFEDCVFKNGFYHIKLRIGEEKLYIIQSDSIKCELGNSENLFVTYNPEKLIIIKGEVN